jgi:hypothetical protein
MGKPRFARHLSDREFEEKPERERRSEVEQSDDRDKVATSDDRDAEIGALLAEEVMEVSGSQGERLIEQTVLADGSIVTEIVPKESDEVDDHGDPEAIASKRRAVAWPRPTPLKFKPADLEIPACLDDEIDDIDDDDVVGVPMVLASPAVHAARLNHLIDVATGQYGGGLDDVFREIVHLVESNEAPLDWRQVVEGRLPERAIKRLDHVFEFDFYDHKRHAETPGHNSMPTADIGKLAVDHLPAIRRLAGTLAGGNEIWFDQLVNAGLRATENAALTFDRTLGSFWTHANP